MVILTTNFNVILTLLVFFESVLGSELVRHNENLVELFLNNGLVILFVGSL